MEKIVITDIKNSGNRLDIYFTVTRAIEKFFLPDHHFFAEYTCDITEVPKSILVIPILVNLLPLSWLTDTIIWVDEIDSSFYEIVQELKHSFTELHHGYEFGGSLIAARKVRNSYKPQNEALQLFTGGVDASTTFYRIVGKNPILFNANGWYSHDIEPDEVYSADKYAISKFGEERDIESCFVRSNFAKFIRGNIVNRLYGKKTGSTWWFGFQHSLAFLGCAVVAGYHFRISTIYIASSYTFGQDVVCVSDPRIDNLFRCASMNTYHDGYELSRQDKVSYLVKYQKEQNGIIPLRVCSFSTHNCCSCEKCVRTMLAIAAENGDIKRFGFELENNLLQAVKNFLSNKITELDADHIVFWRDIIKKMGESYNDISEKEVYNYLAGFPFEEEKKKYLFNYYRKNLFSILKRKTKNYFHG